MTKEQIHAPVDSDVKLFITFFGGTPLHKLQLTPVNDGSAAVVPFREGKSPHYEKDRKDG